MLIVAVIVKRVFITEKAIETTTEVAIKIIIKVIILTLR